MKEVFSAIWTLLGITLGAGILGLPYVFYKAGFYTGLVVVLITAVLMIITHLYLGEVILRTKGKHQLTGLAEKYLGSKGKIVMFLANSFSLYGALAAYVIGSGQALGIIFGTSILLNKVLFLLVLAPLIYFGIKILKNFESIATPIKILVALVLSIVLLRFINFTNIQGFQFSNLLIPYGVSIFAFTGISALPEINEELKNKRNMYKAIIIGMILTLFVYLLFAFAVVGSSKIVSEVATTSLSNLGKNFEIFANIFALFAMGTAFVALGFALKENFTLDYKIKNSYAWLLVIIVPIILSLTGFFGFVKLIELSGAISIGVMLFMILIMHSRAKKLGDRKPEYEMFDNKIMKIIIGLVLVIGIVYTII